MKPSGKASLHTSIKTVCHYFRLHMCISIIYYVEIVSSEPQT